MADGSKYDVFISYSRKDYVENGVEIPGNVVSKIMKLFDDNQISYWIDKKGIYSGSKFMSLITKAISESRMMVFVSSQHSNESQYTAGEVLEALDGNKAIIPIRIDSSPYNNSFRLLLRPLDYIDFCMQPEEAMQSLLRAVLRVKDDVSKKEQEEKKQELIRKKKKHVETEGRRFLLLENQQKEIVRDILQSNLEMGHEQKVCPVCQSQLPLNEPFCLQCGWHFHPLEQLCEGLGVLDETRLALSRSIWSKSSVDNSSAVSSLKKQVESLEGKLRRTDAKLVSMAEERDKLKSELKETKAKLESSAVRGSAPLCGAYVDLGLPSGTMWRDMNESGFFTFDQAVERFGKYLPTREQMVELKDSCKWAKVNDGYQVIGPNGNWIFLPAAGWRDLSGTVDSVGSYGSYWSSTSKNDSFAFGFGFDYGGVFINSVSRKNGRSVRLISPGGVI